MLDASELRQKAATTAAKLRKIGFWYHIPHSRIGSQDQKCVPQAAALGVKTLMMTGNPDRIIEFDETGQPHLSKPFPPEVFLQPVKEILAGI